jgi:signal transduction histidine kinase
MTEIDSLLASCRDAYAHRDHAALESHARAALALIAALPPDATRDRREHEARVHLAFALTEQHRYDEAESVLDVAPIDDDDPDAQRLRLRRRNTLARIYERTRRSEAALAAFTELREEAERVGDRRIAAWGCNGCGRAYADLSRYAESITAFNDGLAIAREIGDRELEAGILNNLALSYQALGDYGRTLECFLDVRTVFDEIAPQSVAGTLINIGNVYDHLGEYHKSLEYALKGLELCEKYGRKQWGANALVNIGGQYLRLGELDRSREYLERGLDAQRSIGNLENAGNALVSLGTVDVKRGDLDAALDRYAEALALFERAGARRGMVNALVEMADARARRGLHDEARAELQRALAIALDAALPVEQMVVHYRLWHFEKERGNAEVALHHFEEHHRIKEERDTAEAKQRLQSMQALHEVESARKEAEIERLRSVELAHALEELKQAQTQLVHSEKMASLGQLTAGLAHEINNPVNFIRASVSPLRRDLDEVRAVISRALDDEPEEVRERVERRMRELELDELRAEIDSLMRGIEEGASRTAEIVRGLRTFSRLDEDLLKDVDLHEGIDSTLTLLRPRIGSVEVVKSYGDLPHVTCNPGQINQVVMNLLTNAIQAVEEKGEEGGRVTITTSRDDDEVSIAIADTGGGIPDAVRARIFEPFFTTKPIGAGTGLGLSISYGIIEKMGGRIDVDTHLGEGTTFTIRLPLRPPTTS